MAIEAAGHGDKEKWRTTGLVLSFSVAPANDVSDIGKSHSLVDLCFVFKFVWFTFLSFKYCKFLKNFNDFVSFDMLSCIIPRVPNELVLFVDVPV